MAERRVILIGKTGNGKSSAGNSILGRAAFEHKRSLVAVTQSCNIQASDINSVNRRYVICDTPGFLDADAKLIDRILQVQESVQICPVPHAFLLVLSSLNRMTEDEKRTIDILRIMFGEKVFNHCIVVFTRGDEFEDDDEFRDFLQESPELDKLIKACGNHVVRIENEKHFDGRKNMREDIVRLLDLIEGVSSGGRKVYKYRWLAEHVDVLKKHLQNYKGEDNIDLRLQDVCNNIARVLRHEDWKNKLQYAAGGAVAVIGGAAALGIGALKLIR